MSTLYVECIGFVTVESAYRILLEWNSSLEGLWEEEKYREHNLLSLRIRHLTRRLIDLCKYYDIFIVHKSCQSMDPLKVLDLIETPKPILSRRERRLLSSLYELQQL